MLQVDMHHTVRYLSFFKRFCRSKNDYYHKMCAWIDVIANATKLHIRKYWCIPRSQWVKSFIQLGFWKVSFLTCCYWKMYQMYRHFNIYQIMRDIGSRPWLGHMHPCSKVIRVYFAMSKVVFEFNITICNFSRCIMRGFGGNERVLFHKLLSQGWHL